jgi:hypothetical protein
VTFFAFKVTNIQNVQKQQQCIVDIDVQQVSRCPALLLHVGVAARPSRGLPVYVVLRCKQHSLEHPTRKKPNCVRSGYLGGYATFSVFH